MKAKGLGRGLDALLGSGTDEPVREALLTLPVSRIRPGRYQPRTKMDQQALAELAASIRSQGLMQPLLVRPIDRDRYELVAGERRLRASRLAERTTIPAIVRDTSDGDQLELALIENVQRADLNPVEEALAYRELIDRFGLSHEAVARRVGKSRVAISNALRLLELAPATRDAIIDGRISEGHGRALAALTSHALQRAVLAVVLSRHLSVRQTEELVRRKRETPASTERSRLPGDLADLEAQLRGVLATKVGIVRTRKGGRLVIDFYSDEELDRIYSIISRGAGGDAAASVQTNHEDQG
jgi:ParB family chromosome partitioning protein